MPLLDLTQVTLNRTVIGIHCPSCSGKLEVNTDRESLWRRLFRREAKRRIRYRCGSCRKRYDLMPSGR